MNVVDRSTLSKRVDGAAWPSLVLISRLSYIFFCQDFFCYQVPNNLGGHSGQFTLMSPGE